MKTEVQQVDHEKERLRKENEELLRHIFRLGCQLFMQTDIYRKVEQKKNKYFNHEDRQQLHTEIHNAFTKLIQIIRDACPNLTNEDIVFCCLAKLNLGNSAICCCMGNAGKQAANQRKYRIKKKMHEAKCEALFDLIFTYNK